MLVQHLVAQFHVPFRAAVPSGPNIPKLLTCLYLWVMAVAQPQYLFRQVVGMSEAINSGRHSNPGPCWDRSIKKGIKESKALH